MSNNHSPVIKLTMVSVHAHGQFRTYFLNLRYNEKGQAVIPVDTLNKLSIMRGLQRGATFTLG